MSVCAGYMQSRWLHSSDILVTNTKTNAKMIAAS